MFLSLRCVSCWCSNVLLQCFTIEKLGRRPLMIGGFAAMGVCSAGITLSLILQVSVCFIFYNKIPKANQKQMERRLCQCAAIIWIIFNTWQQTGCSERERQWSPSAGPSTAASFTFYSEASTGCVLCPADAVFHTQLCHERRIIPVPRLSHDPTALPLSAPAGSHAIHALHQRRLRGWHHRRLLYRPRQVASVFSVLHKGTKLRSHGITEAARTPQSVLAIMQQPSNCRGRVNRRWISLMELWWLNAIEVHLKVCVYYSGPGHFRESIIEKTPCHRWWNNVSDFSKIYKKEFKL